MSSLLLGITLVLSVMVGLGAIMADSELDMRALLKSTVILGAFNAGALVLLFAFADLDMFGAIHLFYLAGVVGLPVLAGILLLVASARGTSRALQAAMAAALLVPAALGVFGTHIEPTRLRVDRQTLTLSSVDQPIRIGVLSDLQTTAVGDYERMAVDTLLAENPDVVIIPGDLYQMPAEQFDQRWPDFAALLLSITSRVPYVFLVEGNVDSVEGLTLITGSGGGRLLDNAVRTADIRGQLVTVGGVGIPDAAGVFDAAPFTQLANADPRSVRLLVSHYPDAASLQPDADLVISGHTHGGQIAIPGFGPLVTLTNVPRAIAAGGLHTLDGTNLYVSTGVGLERGQAPQVRLFVRPSVGIIDLVPTPGS